MESRQILVVSPYKRMTPFIESYCRDFDIKTLVLDSIFDDAVNEIRHILAENPNSISVIISRGATLKLFERKLRDVPRISIDPSEYDLFLALTKAKESSRKVGILSFDSESIQIAEYLAEILNLNVSIYLYSTKKEFQEQIQKIQKDDIEVVIGGGDAALLEMTALKIEYIPLLTSEITIKRALDKAKEIISAAQKERENSKQLQTIIEYTHTGIIATDENKKITIFNPIATKTFGLKKSEVIGKTLSELAEKKYLTGMFSDVSEQLDYIYKTKNTVLLLNRVPIYIQDEFKGILISFKDVTTIQEEESKIRKEIYAKGFVTRFSFEDIIHASSKMSNVIEKAKRFANSDCTVLLQGDSGTGKELVAQSMHNAHGARNKRSFVAVNCASLDNNLLKSELFGYVEGAFTGAAKRGRAGLFELAHGGTIFLDEIGKIKLDIQAILLRVIQEKEIIRIGSDRVIPVDVRIIAATNEDLEELIEKGQFLQDLYFRLNVLKLNIPTLKERREDIPPLVKAILGRLSDHYGKNITTFQSVVFKKLMQLDWPGNIRQLEYLIERCVVLADDEQDASRIMIELIGEEFNNTRKEDRIISDSLFDDYVMVKVDTLQNMERELVHKLSLKGKQTKTELALKLGISRPTLWKLLGDKNIN